MNTLKIKTIITCLVFIALKSITYGQYCTPTISTGPDFGMFIDDVKLGDINNTSTGGTSGPSYNDYTAQSTTLVKETTYELTIGTGTYYLSTYYHVWVDFNGDEDFSDAGEYIDARVSPGASSEYIVSFSVPASAAEGSTRMRITCVYDGASVTACEAYDYGETEDYTIVITPAVDTWLSESGISLAPTYNSSVNWVDIDNDNDLDLAISGQDYVAAGAASGKLYINNGGGSITFEKDIRQLLSGQMIWADFNNNGNPDLFYSGDNGSLISGIDVFNPVTLNYVSWFTGFTSINATSADWGDYDNDGDYDVIMAGKKSDNTLVTYLYRNINTGFELADTSFPGIDFGQVGFIDYDVDGDLDVFITGEDNNGNAYSYLWENADGEFTQKYFDIINVKNSQFDWGDINGDNYPDLVLSGNNGLSLQCKIYINNAGENFYQSPFVIPGFTFGRTMFGDADGDGDLDVFISGVADNSIEAKSFIFINNETDTFATTGFQLEELGKSYLEIGDYDNDNDLDFLVNGYNFADADSGETYIVTNDSVFTNNPPLAPTGLTAEVSGTTVLLLWAHATDDNTPQLSLTYNIYVGTSSKGTDIVSPNANTSNGYRKISAAGYIQDTAWAIKNLSPGTYYFGVQSIDNTLTPSEFSTEQSFVINERFTDSLYNESGNPTSIGAYVDIDIDNDYDVFLSRGGPVNNTIRFSENTISDSMFTANNYKTVASPGGFPAYTFFPNDFNNNNLIDFTLSADFFGSNSYDSSMVLYTCEGALSYSLANQILSKNIDFEYALWADLNNDGLQDFITSGMTTNLGIGNIPVTVIKQNIGDTVFQDVSHNIKGFYSCGAVANDFDGDLDVDIVIYGKDADDSPNMVLYENKGGFDFEEHVLTNNKIYKNNRTNAILSGDYDLNGQPDLYVSGRDSFGNNYARVLLNNNLSFTNAGLGIKSWNNMSNFWGDYDFDGDIDIYALSINGANDVIKLYLNTGTGLEEIEIDLGDKNYLYLPFIAADLDNQYGLDFLVSNGMGQITQFYDNWGSSDRLNSAPSITGYERDSLDILLNWNKLSGCPGYTYNIRVGTYPDSVNTVSPMSDLATGYRYVLQPGNAYLNSSWRLKNLPVGKYYWSVQAINLANSGGPWAPIDSFEVTLLNPKFTHDTVCSGDTTSFTDKSAALGSATINRWHWDFGDGDTSNLQNPKYLYAVHGKYHVTLTVYSDENVEQYSDSVLVLARPEPDFLVAPVCDEEEVQFINATDTGDFAVESFQWYFKTGETNAVDWDTTGYTYTAAGNHSVYLAVMAQNGCSDTTFKTATVAEKPNASIYLVGEDTLCQGDTSKINVVDFNDGFDYTWRKNGAPVSVPDSSSINVLQTGNYSLIIVNPVAGCSDTSNSISITVTSKPAQPSINNLSGVDSICQGDSVQLKAAGTFTGYNFDWRKESGGSAGNIQTVWVETEETYKVRIKESTNDCWSEFSPGYFIKVNPAVQQKDISQTGNLNNCKGDTVTLNINYPATYTLQWKRDGNPETGADSTVFKAVETGEYSVFATSPQGCSNTSGNIVTLTFSDKPPKPVLSDTSLQRFCDGDSVEVHYVGSIDSLVFNWKNSNDANMGSKYNLWLKEQNNYRLHIRYNIATVCWSDFSDTIFVKVDSVPEKPVITTGDPTSNCKGDTVTLTVSNPESYTLQWKRDGNPETGADSTVFKAVETGEYSVFATSLQGCSNASGNIIALTFNDIPPKPVLSDTSLQRFCDGDSVEVFYVGSTDNLVFNWRSLDDANMGSKYNLWLKRQNGYRLRARIDSVQNCWSDFSDTIFAKVDSVPEKPVITTGDPTSNCKGDTVTLTISNPESYTLQWKRNDYPETGADSTVFKAVESGSYTVQVTTSHECSNTSANIVALTFNDIPPKPVLNDTSLQSFCQGDSVETYYIGNPENLIFDWENLNHDEYNLWLKQQGSYRLRVRIDSVEDCWSVFSDKVSVKTLTVPEKPVIATEASANNCVGDKVTLNISASDSFQIQWLRDETIINNNANEITATKSGNYSAKIISNDGCSSTSANAITLGFLAYPSKPELIKPNYNLCAQDSIEISVANVEGSYNYQWLKNGVEIPGANQHKLKRILSEAEYSVKVSNGTCSVVSETDTIKFITKLEKPELVAFGPVVWYIGCTNDKAEIYRWYYNGEIITDEKDNVCIVNQALGDYWLEITDSAGCSARSDTMSIPADDYKSGSIPPVYGDISIYPNPNNGTFNLTINDVYKGNIFIEVYDTDGNMIEKMILNKTTDELSEKLNLGALSTGVYYLALNIQGVVFIEKIMIQ